MISEPPGPPFGRPFRTSRALSSGSLTLLAPFFCSPSLSLPLLFKFPPIFRIFQPPDTPKSLKIIEKPLFFQWFCESHIFLLFPIVAAMWITFSLQNVCKSLQITVLGAPWQLSGDLLCFRGTTFGHSSSLRALSGCLLEPNCAPKALQDHS